MKKLLFILLATSIIAMSAGCGDSDTQNAAEMLTTVKTTQFFTDEEVPAEDIEKILMAGVNAPSAMNKQPWHFTAVTDKETVDILASAMKEMKPPANMGKDAPKPPENMPKDAPKPPEGNTDFAKAPAKAGMGDAPLTIVISCEDAQELSAGLAVQNMAVEAQLLGYGTKILTSPTIALNGDKQAEYNEILGIPENQKVAGVLLVGKADDSHEDAISSATTRKPYDEVVTVIK